jgi:DNA-binding transcriptional ArsR family regulator
MTDWDNLVEPTRGALEALLRKGDAMADRIEELEAKLALVIAAYRIEAMRRNDYSHDAFDQHIAELKGQNQ